LADDLIARISDRTAVVGVVGLGYVGLPLATAYAARGFTTIGFDVDVDKVKAINRGESHVEDVPSRELAPLVDSGRLTATDTPAELADADAVFISVPTPFDEAKTPDLSFVIGAARSVASILHPGMLVVLQSTTFPGTTSEVVQPMLEGGGLRAGTDFHLAFSPERVDPGNATWNVHNTPKVVGGTTGRCADVAAALLAAVMDDPGLVTVLSTPAAAEMTKLLENIYRAVNIALVNELAMLGHEMGLDMWEVIDGASTKPFGFQRFSPGIGPGGHCIPVDPYYLSWRARRFDFQTKFIDLAADTNLRMVHYVRTRVREQLNRVGKTLDGARVVVIGASFKPGVADVRNSRAVRLMELLAEAGAHVSYCDPHVPSLRIAGRVERSVDLDTALSTHDLAVVAVAHPEIPVHALLDADIPVFDAVNFTAGLGSPRVERL
jgi:UDP-N-acetyl-D-glucosamine dehydrogenase